jgi:hypothetical protein
MRFFVDSPMDQGGISSPGASTMSGERAAGDDPGMEPPTRSPRTAATRKPMVSIQEPIEEGDVEFEIGPDTISRKDE